MARPKGIPNKPKDEAAPALTPADLERLYPDQCVQLRMLWGEQATVTTEPTQYAVIADVLSIRQLRFKAIMAGARLKPAMSREDVEASLVSVGGYEAVQAHTGVTNATRQDYAAYVDGRMCQITINGDFRLNGVHDHDLDGLIDALIKFRLDADAHFETANVEALQSEEERAAYLESVKDFDGAPPELTYDQKRIVALADELGVRNCDINMAMTKILEAYGQPLGKSVVLEDGSTDQVMFTPAELESHALKAMQNPL